MKPNFLLLISLISVSESIRKTVENFEILSYDKNKLRNSHYKVKKSTGSFTNPKAPIDLKFTAHQKNFHLKLVPDSSAFHEDFVMVDELNNVIEHDLSHLYSGNLHGVKDSHVHGSILDGVFRGHIVDPHKGTYYVDEIYEFHGGATKGQSPLHGYQGHSVIYHHDDVIMPKKHAHTCGLDNDETSSMMKYYQNYTVKATGQESSVTVSSAINQRRKRAVNNDKNTCLMFIQTDWVLYQEYKGSGNPRDQITSKISSHVQAIKKIYEKTNFEGIRGIGFLVSRLRINSTRENAGKFQSEHIGVEQFLVFASEANHDQYCLAYVFTARDFDHGTLGLAWVADPGRQTGGICEKNTRVAEGKRSLNTGIVTFKNYGNLQSSAVSHITFAHEVGHNFGSPHDESGVCTPGDSNEDPKGNYIMYARATNGDKENNNLFSPCSIRKMSAVLRTRKDECFKPFDQERCGNGILEDGEECDCGYPEDCKGVDDCCIPAGEVDECKLKPGKVCSPSQGPCCSPTCELYEAGYSCSEATDCKLEQQCDGSNVICPQADSKPDHTECAYSTKLCKDGECSESRCSLHDDYEGCNCQVAEGVANRTILCHTCCKKIGADKSKCMSIIDPSMPEILSKRLIVLQPGSPCDNNRGYCDVRSVCREVDAEGPLSRVRNAIFNPLLYNNIKDWIIQYWWAVSLMVLALMLLMLGFVKLCSVHTPSSNPSLPKHRQFPGYETLRRRQQTRRGQGRNNRSQQSRRNTIEMQQRRTR